MIHAFSHIEGARIGICASIGPFARLRPGAGAADVFQDPAHLGDPRRVAVRSGTCETLLQECHCPGVVAGQARKVARQVVDPGLRGEVGAVCQLRPLEWVSRPIGGHGEAGRHPARAVERPALFAEMPEKALAATRDFA